MLCYSNGIKLKLIESLHYKRLVWWLEDLKTNCIYLENNRK